MQVEFQVFLFNVVLLSFIVMWFFSLNMIQDFDDFFIVNTHAHNSLA